MSDKPDKPDKPDKSAIPEKPAPVANGGDPAEERAIVGRILNLIDVSDRSGLASFHYRDESFSIRLGPDAPTGVVRTAAAPPAAAPAELSRPAGEPAPAGPAGETVASPIAGTFYAAPAPNTPPFIHLNDPVAVGQTLCIVEAMKLMNEIKSAVAGRVVKIHAKNADIVSQGQPLFTIGA